MLLFSTHSAEQIARSLNIQRGRATIKRFCDNEIFVRIDENVANQHVWVVATTQPPADNLLEFFFLCDALKRSGARISAIISYMAYARQVLCAEGEAHSAQLISSYINSLGLEECYIIHPHSELLHNFLRFKTIRCTEFFYDKAMHYDLIAIPDAGASTWGKELALACNKNLVQLQKVRPSHDCVEIVSLDGDVKNKKVLIIDDIISTGHTIVQAADTIKNLGAQSVAAAIVHGIFAPGAVDCVVASPLEKIFVTNSVEQQAHEKICVTDIAPLIQNLIYNQEQYASQ